MRGCGVQSGLAEVSNGTPLLFAARSRYGKRLRGIDARHRRDVSASAGNALAIFLNSGSAFGRFQSQMQMVTASRVAKGHTELDHFAASLRTHERDRTREARLKLSQGIILLLIGGVMGALLNALTP